MPDVSVIDFNAANPLIPSAPGSTASRLKPRLRRLIEPLCSFRVQTALLFGGLTVLVCGAAAFALGDMMTSEIRRNSGRALDTLAQTASRTLASGLAQRLLETQVLAGSASIWADGLDSPTVQQALARTQASQPWNTWIGVADTTGQVRAATSGILVGQSVAKRPWYGEALRGDFVGDVHAALLLEKLLPKPANDEPIRFVDFAAPIKVGGKVVGALGVHGTWDWARDVVHSLMPADAAAQGIDLLIFDRAGKVLHAPHGAAAVAGLTLDALRPLPAPAKDGHSEAQVTLWPDGQAYLTTVVALPSRTPTTDMGWQIVAREPVHKAFARARLASQRAFGVALVLALVAGWLAWLASGVLGRPLVTLARAARDVQRRVPGAAIPLLEGNRELRHLSTALAGMTGRLDATYRTAPIGMCQTDLRGTVLSTNGRLAEMLGESVDALPGQRLSDRLVAPERAAFLADLAHLGAGRTTKLSRQLLLKLKAGGDLCVSLCASIVPSSDGEDPYLIVVVEDISLRMAAEATSRANAARTAFLSQVSHELRTPLNAVLGYGQLMKLDAIDLLSEKQTRRVDGIVSAGKHLLAMINDLLDLTQVESNRMTLSLEPVLLPVVVEESTALVSEAARLAEVTLVFRPPASALVNCVQADQVRLRQVVVNLLGNAVKYNRKGGSVTVAWGQDAATGAIELSVTDTGRGIPADRIDQLFQPFNRLGAENSGVQGTGIGLVITRKLVEMMNGDIRVQSTHGVGSCFSVRLPVATPPVLDTPTASQFDALNSGAVAPADQRTLLLVEDNEVNIEILRSAIEFRPHLRLLVARNGNEAMAMAAQSAPDAFMLDMHLGDMTGLQLASRLRTLPGLAGTPLIAVSADTTTSAIRLATQAGFAAYMTKPINLRKLLALLDDTPGLKAPEPAPETESVGQFG